MTNFTDPIVRLRLESATDAKRALDFTPDKAIYDRSGGAGASVPYLRTMSVTTRLGTSNDISASLELPYDWFDSFMEEWFDLFTPGQTVRAQLGYSEGEYLTREFSGTVIGLPSAAFQPDVVVLSLEAKGSLWFSSRNERSFSTKGQTIFEIVKSLSATYGSKVYYLKAGDKTERELVSGNAEFGGRMGVALDEVFKTNEFELLRDLIIIRAQLGFYINGNRFVVYDPSEHRLNLTQELFFEYRSGRVDQRSSIFPMISPSVENAGIAFAKGTGALASRDMDLDKAVDAGEDVLTRDDDRVNMVQLKAGARDDSVGSSSGVFGDRAGVASSKAIISRSDPAYDAKLAYLKMRAEDVSGTKMGWQTIAWPGFLPGQMAVISGLSFLYDGRYQISEVSYSYGGGGLECSLKAFSPGQSPAQTDVLTDLPRRVADQTSSMWAGPDGVIERSDNVSDVGGTVSLRTIDPEEIG